MSFSLPDLPYAHNAMEPHIDAKTMEIHHGKHHAGYVSKLNSALESHSDLQNKSLEDLIGQINSLPADIKTAVRNNGGGHWNHSFFWNVIGGKGGQPEDAVGDALKSAFGSFDDFKAAFIKAGATRFGSGWAWLIVNKAGKLEVCSTPNQDNPLMDVAEVKGQPILGIDVWEHAYYLNYQNRRPDYLNAFFNVINWDAVSEYFKNVK